MSEKVRYRFLFYKPPLTLKPRHLLGLAINAVTSVYSIARGNFKLLWLSHEELHIPEIVGGACWFGRATTWRGQCFSSASYGDKIGVRFAPANEILKHPERWRYKARAMIIRACLVLSSHS